MMHYNHSCPKRSVLWSNSRKVLRFKKGRLTKQFKLKQQKLHGAVKTTKRKLDEGGRERYTASAALKPTQTGS